MHSHHLSTPACGHSGATPALLLPMITAPNDDSFGGR